MPGPEFIATQPEAGRRVLLVVEPDHLTRWSMQEYLRDYFQVLAADGLEQAFRYLEGTRIDAVILADDMPGVQELEEHVRQRNPFAIVVRTVTDPASISDPVCVRLEKPFQLADLAISLGVTTGAHVPASRKRL